MGMAEKNARKEWHECQQQPIKDETSYWGEDTKAPIHTHTHPQKHTRAEKTQRRIQKFIRLFFILCDFAPLFKLVKNRAFFVLQIPFRAPYGMPCGKVFNWWSKCEYKKSGTPGERPREHSFWSMCNEATHIYQSGRRQQQLCERSGKWKR